MHRSTLGQVFHEDTRLARVTRLSSWNALAALRTTPHDLLWKILQPRLLLRRWVMMIPSGLDWNERPAAEGVRAKF